MEMVPWLLDHVPPKSIPALLASFPPTVACRYYDDWKPRYDAEPRW